MTRDTTHFLSMEGDGSGARLLDRVPGAWTLRREVAGRRMFMLQPMTTYPTWTTMGDTLYIAPGEWAEVRVVGQEGVHRILRRSVAPRALEAADRSAWEEGMLRLSPEGDRDEARRLLDDLELPQRLPFYRNVLVDPDGHVWAERFESPGLGPGVEWDVYDPDGRYLGSVATPSNLAIYEVGLDHVLGIWADDLGVQRVRVHRLERGALADQAAHGERSSSGTASSSFAARPLVLERPGPGRPRSASPRAVHLPDASSGRTDTPSTLLKARSKVATRPSADCRATATMAASAKLSPRSPWERKMSTAARNTSEPGTKTSSRARSS